MNARREKVSAFVVSFNRAGIIGTCLRALRFADELIVVDKSSTDDTPAIAARHADRVVTVPWSETVEGTRAFAASLCMHEWIVFLDDDECLSPGATQFIQAEVRAPRAEIYEFPLRHYILGEHDEHAYYWPEYHVRCFRRGAVAFTGTVHAGLTLRSDRVLRVDADSGACIHHLSHQNVAQWLAKANRYTSRPDRVRPEHAGHDLIAFAHARIDHWIGRTRDASRGGYPAAVALLRATYDLIDRLKVWEEERGLDGGVLFLQVCATLDAAHDGALTVRAGDCTSAAPQVEPAAGAEATLRTNLRELRALHDAAMSRMSAREAALARELADARAALCCERMRVIAAEAETATHRQAAERSASAAAAATATAEAAVATAAATAEAAVATAAATAEAAVATAAATAASAAATAASAVAALRAIEDSTFWQATAWPRRVADRLRAHR